MRLYSPYLSRAARWLRQPRWPRVVLDVVAGSKTLRDQSSGIGTAVACSLSLQKRRWVALGAVVLLGLSRNECLIFAIDPAATV